MHGDEKSTKEMEEFCRSQKIVQDRIFTPRIGEIADATLETQIYNVKNLNYKNNFDSDWTCF